MIKVKTFQDYYQWEQLQLNLLKLIATCKLTELAVSSEFFYIKIQYYLK